MGEKRPVAKIAEMTPAMQFITALICVLIVFIIAYPVFILAGRLAGVDLTAFNQAISGEEPDLISLKYLQVVQQISLFILPVLTWSYLLKGNIVTYTGLNILPRAEHFTLALLISLLIIPVNSYAASLNLEMQLPDWLSGTEEWMRGMEDQGEILTSLLIRSETIQTLILNLFVLAVIPALGEELFFRGLLQRLLRAIVVSPHLAIIITSVIFSALHFQFFGFLPRFILGLIYGYLFLWSGTVWLPAFAHFVNNALPVVLSYLYGWDTVSGSAIDYSTDEPLFPMVSLIAVILLMAYAARVLKTGVDERLT
jgi:uncharacterized protein